MMHRRRREGVFFVHVRHLKLHVAPATNLRSAPGVPEQAGHGPVTGRPQGCGNGAGRRLRVWPYAAACISCASPRNFWRGIVLGSVTLEDVAQGAMRGWGPRREGRGPLSFGWLARDSLPFRKERHKINASPENASGAVALHGLLAARAPKVGFNGHGRGTEAQLRRCVSASAPGRKRASRE